MKRPGRTGLTLAALVAAGAGGFWAGGGDLAPLGLNTTLTSWLPTTVGIGHQARPMRPVPTGPIVYYRDPDGRPFYSEVPKKTADGRDFSPVHASEDVTFDDKPVAAAKTAPDGEPKKVLYYRNPMGLAATSPVPKKDSMEMDYLPVYAGDEDGSVIKIEPGKLQRTGVRSEVVSEQVIVRPVRVPGVVQADERRISVVSVPTDAFVGKVENITTGERVRKGQPLLQIRSPDIAAAAVQVTINPGFEGTHRRLENLGVPPEIVGEIERTRQVPTAFVWPSPRDGTVLERNAIEGMKMSAGTVLFRIADLSSIWVLADVPEYALAGIQLGQIASIRIRSVPDRMFQGRVTLIYPEVAKETRTTKIRIELPNPENLLRPGMYADVEVATGEGNPVVAVPNSAVIDTGTRQLVLLDKGDGRFEPRPVKLGVQGSGFIEIRDGLAAGDRVVVAANFLIDAESKLKAALDGMTAVGATP